LFFYLYCRSLCSSSSLPLRPFRYATRTERKRGICCTSILKVVKKNVQVLLPSYIIRIIEGNNLVENYFTTWMTSAVWSISEEIDIKTDVLSWINGRLESLLAGGATEVNVVQGNAFVDYIIQEQARGKYLEIKLSDSDIIEAKNCVIIVVMDKNGDIIDNQMIRSKKGVSAQLHDMFKGQPVLKIKIPE